MEGKILILGGSGFIGTHLLRKCINEGFNCLCVCLKNTNNFTKSKNVNYLKLDINDYAKVKELLGGKKFDYIVNLAGYINHINFSEGGRDTFNTHSTGLLNILQAVNLKKIKRVVQIGSSDEYGNLESPQNELMRELPFSPYSLAKLTCTNILQMLYRTEKLPVVIIRLFLVYGEGQDFKRFLPQVIKGCLLNEKFPTTQGQQIRDFCYVDDVVEGIFKALISEERVAGEIINIASGNPIKIKTIIEKIVNIIGSGNPLYGERKYRQGESMSLYADINKARKILNWEPKINIDNGLEKTIKYYKNFFEVNK